MTEHKWSEWRASVARKCLNCGCVEPFEAAVLDGNFVEVADDSEMGFHFEFPADIVMPSCSTFSKQEVSQ